MAKENIKINKKGPVVHVVNDNAATRNSLSDGFVLGFTEFLEGLAKDRGGTRAIVLSGAGGYFCSGGNVDGLKERTELDLKTRRKSVDKIHGLIHAMRNCEVPIIAAIEGGAAGAGVGLALACDMVFASEESYFMAAYVKIGVTPDGGLTAFMSQGMPRWMLAQMVFTGDRVPAKRFHELGIVNEVTKNGGAEAAAMAMAERLAGGPSTTIANGKKLISSARQNTLSDQLNAEADNIAEALGSENGKEGIAAFLEKRQANFS